MGNAGPGPGEEIDLALIEEMVGHWTKIPSNLLSIATTPDVYSTPGDPKPGLFVLLTFGRSVAKLGRLPKSMMEVAATQFDDIAWNGTPIP